MGCGCSREFRTNSKVYILPVNAVGLMPRVMGTRDDEVHAFFGTKDLAEVIEFSEEGNVAAHRLGDAPYALITVVGA